MTIKIPKIDKISKVLLKNIISKVYPHITPVLKAIDIFIEFVRENPLVKMTIDSVIPRPKPIHTII